MLLSVELYEVRYGPVLKEPVIPLATPEEVALEEKMVAAWARRYYRAGPTIGLEVFLLRKGTATGRWAVTLPDGSIAEIILAQKSTIRSQPNDTILYTGMPVLSEARKAILLAEATRQVTDKSIRRDASWEY